MRWSFNDALPYMAIINLTTYHSVSNKCPYIYVFVHVAGFSYFHLLTSVAHVQVHHHNQLCHQRLVVSTRYNHIYTLVEPLSFVLSYVSLPLRRTLLLLLFLDFCAQKLQIILEHLSLGKLVLSHTWY